MEMTGMGDPEKTFAQEMREEDERLRRRMVHATRPHHPMSLDEAMELSKRMAGDDTSGKTE